MPIEASGALSAGIVENATLNVFEGRSHGLAQTGPEKFNAAVEAFLKG